MRMYWGREGVGGCGGWCIMYIDAYLDVGDIAEFDGWMDDCGVIVVVCNAAGAQRITLHISCHYYLNGFIRVTTSVCGVK